MLKHFKVSKEETMKQFFAPIQTQADKDRILKRLGMYVGVENAETVTMDALGVTLAEMIEYVEGMAPTEA